MKSTTQLERLRELGYDTTDVQQVIIAAGEYGFKELLQRLHDVPHDHRHEQLSMLRRRTFR